MPTTPEPTIVIDTNVLISAGLLPNSVTARALVLAVEHFVIAQSAATWHELETRIARPRFDRYFGPTGRLRHLAQIAQSIRVFDLPSDTAEPALSRDPTDDKFLRLAVTARARFIVSGDGDLLSLGRHHAVDIISPAQFVSRLAE